MGETHARRSVVEELLGKNVEIAELQPNGEEPVVLNYRGRVAKIDGHMLLLADCKREPQCSSWESASYTEPIWFNTLASTFMHIEVL
jgi:hypothetical protein